MPRCLPLAALFIGLAACTPAQTDGIDPEGKAFSAVAPDEKVTLLGNEPFWTFTAEGSAGLWTTPDNMSGTRFKLVRFAGNGGMGFSGELAGKAFTATLTPCDCSDGMSERRFPFVATIALGGETLRGCGYTTSQPFTGDEAP
jgi:uncharacterized membrane protein